MSALCCFCQDGVVKLFQSSNSNDDILHWSESMLKNVSLSIDGKYFLFLVSFVIVWTTFFKQMAELLMDWIECLGVVFWLFMFLVQIPPKSTFPFILSGISKNKYWLSKGWRSNQIVPSFKISGPVTISRNKYHKGSKLAELFVTFLTALYILCSNSSEVSFVFHLFRVNRVMHQSCTDVTDTPTVLYILLTLCKSLQELLLIMDPKVLPEFPIFLPF